MPKNDSFELIKERLALIIFDLDGTLVDSSKPMAEAFNHTLANFDVPRFRKKEADALIGIPLSEIFMKIFNRPTRDKFIEDCIKVYRKKYLEICCKQSFLYEGVSEILPKLAGKYTISLATTKKTDVAIMTLKYFELFDYFTLIYGFDTVSKPKPSPEIIQKTLNQLNIDSEKAMMVGDSLFDLNAGKAAGVFTCSVSYGFEKIEKIIENQPDVIIDNFKELEILL